MAKKPNRVPESQIPTIGDKSYITEETLERAMRSLLTNIQPILDNVGIAIDGITKRIEVLEEVKQIIPKEINVIIKKEK